MCEISLLINLSFDITNKNGEAHINIIHQLVVKRIFLTYMVLNMRFFGTIHSNHRVVRWSTILFTQHIFLTTRYSNSISTYLRLYANIYIVFPEYVRW